MTAARKVLPTAAANVSYLSTFLAARNSAATPEVMVDDGVADNAAPAPGSATAMSTNR